MGYVVCHIQKPKGNDAGTSAHIERRVHPSNADQSREHLNQKLVEYPDGVENRTQAITHRIETAGITRKVGTNQVRALRIMLSGSPEDMHRIVAKGRLDEWCADNVKWLLDTFGVDNVVAVDLHRDEQTPHIHATVVPIVSGERRKVREQKKREVGSEQGENHNSQDDSALRKSGKRAYRKKPANTVRLCADDVMTRDNLERFQDTYAEAMAKYGLQRGVRGSDARHIATTQYYRDLHVKNEGLREDIAELEEQKETRQQEVAELAEQEQQARTRTEQASAERQQAETALADKQSELQRVKSELKTEKFKNSAAEVGTKLMGSVGSLFGSSKIERQQQEINTITAENEGQKQEITRLTQTINRERTEHQKTVGDLKNELDKIDEWLPDAKPLIKMGEYCRGIGFSGSQAKELIAMKPVWFTGELYSNEHSQRFKATDAEARFEKRDNAFRLLIDGTGIIQWFRQKHQEFLRRIGINIKDRTEKRGHTVK